MRLDKAAIDTMNIIELEQVLEQLRKEGDTYPHLAVLLAYALTYHYYYIERNDKKAKLFFNDTIRLLDIPSGYGWCYVSVHMLAGIPMPHYLHEEVVKKAFSRLCASPCIDR